MAKANAKLPTTSDDGKSDKVQAAAFEIRKQGGTAAIICHTLGISYTAATAYAAAFDKKVGHAPQKIARTADGIKLDGWVVKDGRQAPAAGKTKTASKAKTTKKA